MSEQIAQAKIDEIMDDFDFGKVVRVMQFLGWKWSMNGELRIPTEPEIRREARRLLTDLASSERVSGDYTRAGGLAATRWETELWLGFEIEWQYTEGEDE